MNQLDYIVELLKKYELRLDKIIHRKKEVFEIEQEIVNNIQNISEEIKKLQTKSEYKIIPNKDNKKEIKKSKRKTKILILILVAMLIILKKMMLFYPFLFIALGISSLRTYKFLFKKKKSSNKLKENPIDTYEEILASKKLKKQNLMELMDNLIIEKNILIQEENYLFGLINRLEQYKMELEENTKSDIPKSNNGLKKIRERRNNNGKNI